MNLSDIFGLISTVTLVAGVLFAVIQIRQANKARAHANMLSIIQSYVSAEFSAAIGLIFDLPTGLNKKEIEDYLGEDVKHLNSIIAIIESLGVLLHRGELSIELIDDFFGGPIVLTWQKLEIFIEDLRIENQRGTIGEWVQWLAEQMMLLEKDAPAIGAHILYKDWRPPT